MNEWIKTNNKYPNGSLWYRISVVQSSVVQYHYLPDSYTQVYLGQGL